MKKLVSLFMTVITIVSLMLPVFAYAENPSSLEKILSEYHYNSLKLSESNAIAYSSDGVHTLQEQLAEDTVQELRSAGYDSYVINNETYGALEDFLETDFSQIGLKNDSTYIVVVGDTPQSDIQVQSTTSGTYTYTYNSKKYTLRTLTFTSTDDTRYRKNSCKDLLTSHTKSFIENLLNSAVSAVLDYVASWPIGTITSAFGLKLVNFADYSDSTMMFYAGTSWTRVYTQVYDDSMNQWTYGSMVEFANKRCSIKGMKYYPELNGYDDYDTGNLTNTSYSSNYWSSTWKSEKAIVSLIGGLPVFSDRTGSVTYKYGNKVIITHSENF